jgi:transcriptional regulator with XRE-family HTH domain
MTDYRSESSIGARIKATRRQRGYRTTRELAEAMPGSNVTAAILENIESGRKADLSISQLLNIARALTIPPSYLLAPLGRPNSPLDLPNLSDAFAGVTAAEFDSWFAAIPTSAYRSSSAAERTDIDQLNALRELHGRRREATRLRAVLQIQDESGDSDLTAARLLTEDRLADVVSDIRRLEQFLESAGYLAEGS